MSIEETSSDPSRPSTEQTKENVLAQLEEARKNGGLIHDMPPQINTWLEEYHGIYTTTEPRHPGSLQEFRTDLNRERALSTIADRVYEGFKEVPEYRESIEKGELGSFLSNVFGEITAIDAHNIHVPNSNIVEGKKEMGTFVAESMIFTLPTQEASRSLSSALQILLRSQKGAPVVHESVQKFEDSSDAQYAVDLKVNEHQIRFLARAVSAVVAREDKRVYGLTLPLEKLPLADWEEQGETLPPGIKGRLEAANANYRQQLRVSYQGETIDEKKENLLGTEAAAALQGMRDIMNVFIHEQRKRYSNPEQDPDLDARPFIEEDIILKRDLVDDTEDRRGPQTSRTLTIGEKAKEQGIRVYENARQKPFYTFLEVGKAVLSGGAEWVMTGLQHSEGVRKPVQQFVGDVVTWRRHTQEAMNAGSRLDKIIANERFLNTIAEDTDLPPQA